MTKLLVLFVFHKYDNRVKQFIEKCIFKDKNVVFIKGRGAVGRVGRGVRDRHMRSTSG